MLSLLDKTVRTAKWHGKPLPETMTASVKETLNGDFVLSFTYPITDSGLYRELKEDYLVRSPVPVLGHQLFRIKKVIEGDTSLDVTAYHISDDIMTRLVAPFKCDQVPCATALSSLVMASKSALADFSFTSDIVKNRTYTSDKEQTLYSALLDGKHSIVGTWEGELIRDNLALSIKANRGQDRGVVISTHYNLKKYQRTKESSQLITRIHATSTFKQEGQEKDTVLTVTVDSPLINAYPFINEVTYTNNNLKTRQELIEWASTKFRLEGIDKPKDAIVIEAFELDGQTVHLGDTVTLKSKLHGIDMRKKAVAYDYDPLTETYRSITFDDKAGIGSSKAAGGLSSLASNLIESHQRSEDVAVELAIENANRAFEAEFEKRQVAIDDAIEQAQSHGEVYADRLKASIDSAISAINQKMRTHEEENNRTTRDILAKAGANANLANEAKLKAEQAQTGATEALRRAEQAKLDAIQEANRLTTNERSQTETKIASAKTQAIQEANRLLDVAKSALNGQLNTMTTSLNQTKEDIKLLARKQAVESLTGRVTTAESSIRLQADQIAQRVKTSDFDQAKQRLNTAETTITQLGNRITTEIRETVAKIPTEIGATNLLRGTRDFTGPWTYNSSKRKLTDWKYGDFSVLNVDFMWYGLAQLIPVKAGETYTFSAYVASTINNDVAYFYNMLNDGRPEKRAGVTGNGTRFSCHQYWTRVHFVFKVTSDGFIAPRFERNNTNATLYIAGMQLERQSILTDWSPSPEDVEEAFSSVQTKITQTASGVEQVSTRLTEATGKISSAETQIRQLVSDVSSKVSQTDFNTVKRTVESHTTSINQTTQSILLKADKTFVDGVKSTAENALTKATSNANLISQTKAELTVANDAIAQKVAKTDFNQLTGRVTTAETTIRNQAGEITKRLTSTQVYQAITAKGYQTKAQVDSNITSRGYITNAALGPYATTTVLENKVRETTDSFTRRISQTESQIPRTVAHRNVVAGTSDKWNAYQTITVNTNWIASLGRVHFGDISGIYPGSKVHLYVHVSADEIVLDTAVASRSMKLQGPVLDNTSSWTWTNWNLYHPFYNKWSSNLNAGNNYRLIKLTTTVTQEMYNHSKGFELQVRIDGVKSGKFHWRALMVTTGDLAPDYWTPSLDDFATVTAFHEVRDTVSSHTRTIGEHTTRISQVVQTAHGLISRVGHLADTQNLVYDPTNFSKYRERVANSNLLLTGTNEYKLLRITQSGLTSNGWRGFQMPLHSKKFVQGEKLSYRVNLWVDVIPDDIVGFEIKNGGDILGTFSIQPTRTGDAQIFTGTFTVTKTTMSTDDYGLHVWLRRNGQVAVGQLSIVRGDVPPTTFVDSTSAQQMATESVVQQHAGSYAISTLTNAGKILNQLNLNKDGSVKIDGKLVQITGTTYIQDGIISNAKIASLDAGKIVSGIISAARIGAEAITSDKLKVDQAFFNKFMANEGYLRQLFAKSAFITQVQAVTLSASKISGGILAATNGAMRINLNDGTVKFYTNSPSISREVTGYPHQWVSFETGTSNGKPCGVTIIGSNRWNNWNSNDGGFVGIRAWNGASDDQIDIVGDLVRLASSPFTNPDGWDIKTLPNKLNIDAHRAADRPTSILNIGDVRVFRTASNYVSLKDVLQQFNHNFKHLVNITGRGDVILTWDTIK